MNNQPNSLVQTKGKTLVSRLGNLLQVLLFTVIGSLSLPTHAADLNISDVPLYLGGNVDPNVFFTLDDSGSMHWEAMPDELRNLYGTNYVFPRAVSIYGGNDYADFVPTPDSHIYNAVWRSSATNKIYYDPKITYLPWKRSDGSSYPNAVITAAWHNPENTAAGSRNLTVANAMPPGGWDVCTPSATATWTSGWTCTMTTTPATFWPATYFNYGGTDTMADYLNLANYTRVEIRSTTLTYTGSSERTDCVAAPTCSYAEEIQNFANWYTYYRSRILTARAGIGRAFALQPENMRVGFGTLNQGNSPIDGRPTQTLITGVRPFSGTDRDDFFNNLYTHVMPTASTPLRRALDDVGQYFSWDDNRGPWGNTPGTDDGSATSDHLTCRQNFNILMSDGYWNSTAATVATGNVDGDNPAPFNDTYSDTLADVGMYYWENDLRTDLDNEVPTNAFDPADWQHMVTFTVGLGVTGDIDPDFAFQQVANYDAGSAVTAPGWGDPHVSNPAKIDDMLHTAVNSRGGFFSASNPNEFANALNDTLTNIASRSSSAAAIASNSTRLDTNTYIYQAKFDSGDWSGHLLAYSLNQNDGSVNQLEWDVNDTGLIPKHGSRNIVTWNDDKKVGVDFDSTASGDLSNFHEDMREDLGDNPGDATDDAAAVALVDYLRGDTSNEVRNGGTYRNRNFILGDIVNSDPWFVGVDNFGYQTLPAPEGLDYIDFRGQSSYQNRRTMIYVGANDGMLHGFDATTGKEILAFVPSDVASDLPDLADPAYSHNFYVDSSPRAADAYINGAWKTVLIGSTGAGGKSVFALDVTDPDAFNANKVLWEFTHEELGYTIGQPSIVRLENGDWVAIFGNGYNSKSHTARLFIVNLEDGSLLDVIDTEVGDATTPNGLATPIVVDSNGDRSADVAYAGDLYGNLWKFDISGSNSCTCKIPFSSKGSPAPLFTAVGPNGEVQPITAKPQVGAHPDGGLIVLFGTGKYLEVGDNIIPAAPDVQSLYGVIDRNGIVTRGDMLEQTIFYEESNTFTNPDTLETFDYDIRTVTDNPMTSELGWYIDLISPPPNNFGAEGERVVTAPLLWPDRVIFATMIPDPDPCSFGGTSWLMEIDPFSGSRLGYSVFDLNHDGAFDDQEYVTVVDPTTGATINIPVSGKRSKQGIIKTPGVISADTVKYKYTSGSTGVIEVTKNLGTGDTGRLSWQQLK